MNIIPTAEKYFKQYANLYHFEEGSPEYLVDKEDFSAAMIEFAKLHVQAQQEAILENAEAIEGWNSGLAGNAASVDKQSIIDAYPIPNIK